MYPKPHVTYFSVLEVIESEKQVSAQGLHYRGGLANGSEILNTAYCQVITLDYYISEKL